MPVVPAASIPYTPYPTSEPEIRSPRVFQDIRPSSAAFGGQVGEAEQGLGRGIERAGDVLAEGAIRGQELANQVAVNNSRNWWEDKQNKLHYGDPNVPGDTGFFGKQGQAAVDAYPDIRAQVDKDLAEARSQLANPRQQLGFDNETFRVRNYLINALGDHYGKQLNELHKQTVNAKITNGMFAISAASSRGDDNEFQLRLGQTMNETSKGMKEQGASQDMIDAKLHEIKGHAVEQRTRDLADKDPLKARAFLDANQELFVPDKRAELADHIRSRETAQQAMRDVGGVIMPGATGVPPANVPPQFQEIGKAAADKNGVPWDIFSHTISGESGWNPDAVGPPVGKSGLRAQGISQFMPETAAAYGVNPKDPNASLEGAAKYLSDLQKKSGSWTEALSTYLGSKSQESTQAVINSNPSYAKAFAAAQAVDSGATANSNPDTLYKEPNIPAAKLPVLEAGMLPDNQVPGLGQKLEQIFKNIPADAPPERFQAAVNLARKNYNAAYQAQEQQHRLDKQKHDDEQKKIDNEYMTRLAPDNPNQPTVNEVLSDTRLDADKKRTIVGTIERQGKTDPASVYDAANKHDLFERMTRDYGTPGKLTTEKELDQAFNDQKVTWSSYRELVAKFRDLQTVDGEKIGKAEKELISQVAPAIWGPNLIDKEIRERDSDIAMRENRPSADQRMARYRSDLYKKIDEYKTANKNPQDLFDQSKPDYFGKPETVKSYLAPMRQKAQPTPHVALQKPLPEMSDDELKAFGRKASVSGNDFDYEQAEKEARRRGWYQPKPVPEGAPIR